MKINLVVNNDGFTGLSCYSSNLKRVLSGKVRINLIDTRKHMPWIVRYLSRILPFDLKTVWSNNPVFLPLGKYPLRKKITHLTTQNFALPLVFSRCKSVVTVHDMILFEKKMPEGKASLFKKILLKAQLMGLKRANRIIADSHYTKKRIIKMLGYSSNKIDVVYLGVDKKKYKPLKIKKDAFTVLYVGSEMPRKNIPVLLKAFAKLKQKIPKAKLVKIGKPQWPGSRKKLKALASRLGIADSVVFKDHSENLAAEYSKAALLVHPSIYEGFGFPVIEAMACGCPVICSDKTSLPEVGGKAAIYFDGHDSDDLAQKMHKVMKDRKLQKKMIKKGLEQAKRFSWKKCAEETISIYNKL